MLLQRQNACLAFPSLSYLWIAAPESTLNVVLMHFYWIYSALFAQQIASHMPRRLAIWHCVQWRPRASEKKGGGAIWIGVWSTLKRFFFFFPLSPGMLTWPDQKHPTGTDPCSHKGKPLMLLPWLPCWTHEPPVDAWLEAVTKSL